MALTDLNAFTRASKTTIFKELAEYVGSEDLMKFATVVQADSDSVKYEWLGQVAGVSEWLDERQIHAMEQFEYTIQNRDWELSQGFNKNTIADTIKSITPVLQEMAQSAAEHPWELLIELIVANSACFDGQNFFDNSHPFALMDDNTETFDNRHAITGTTEANIRADFLLVLKAFATFKKRNGRPLFRGNSLGVIDIICHPDQYATFLVIFEKADTTGGMSNELYKRARITQDAGIVTGKWYAAVTNKRMKPFILQERQALQVMTEGPNFSNKKYLVGVDARYNVGYAFPQLMISVGI